MALSRFFIDRPVFAWVLAIVIMVAGAMSAFSLPIEQYPVIAPPSVVINAFYPGADATTVQNSVTHIIEQQLTGLDNLIYFSSQSTADGSVQITTTFAAGTDPDIAQVQVQNKLQQAVAQLPSEVQQIGVTVMKSGPSFILVIAVYDTGDRYSDIDISDFLVSKLQDPLSRITGVGNAFVFGAPYAMRIWLDPYKLYNYSLEPSDVRNAIQAQNVQVSAGSIGGLPVVPGQAINATVTAQSQLQSVKQFRDIILKAASNGAVVHLSDVARVELGGDSYASMSLMNGRTASGLAITPSPGANALKLVEVIKNKIEALEPSFPAGLKLAYTQDNTAFIKLSIRNVIITLVEAILLVILVMYVFLQNWRTTLVPAVAVPVVLLGTFGILAATGYSINTLTLFALVLAIGLLVDDAIVVVENVERIMREEGLPPRQATLRSMREITGALIGIGLVLTAVFLPMAFFGGSTGVIYRQFSVTIVSAMLLSIMCALVLTPALCATLLTPIESGHHHHGRGLLGRFFIWFNASFEDTRAWYRHQLERILNRPKTVMFVYGVIVLVLVFLIFRLPTGFLPDEDQGVVVNLINAPSGTELPTTLSVARKVTEHYLTDEKRNVDFVFSVAGFSFLGAGQNQGIAFVHLKNWADRPGSENTAQSISRRTSALFGKLPEAQVFSIVPPSVPDLGVSTGVDVQMEDRGNLGHDGLIKARDTLLGMAAQNPMLAQVRPNSLDDAQQLHVDIDQEKASALGVATTDIDTTLSTAWGGTFVNNFIDRGRVKRVYMQGDAPFRMTPGDLNRWYVRTSTGTMAPFSSFATTKWTLGPNSLTRYNGYPAIEIQGQAVPGVSSGTALREMDKLFKKLPAGVGYELTGLSYQEQQSGAQAPALYGLSILIIYLCLAALYESWAIPLSVMLVIPLGVIGAVGAASLRGLFNDIYFQVGLLATIGLSAKNAILIVEFAVEGKKNGLCAREAALEAARLRLRPILMTSIAFIAGVFPLAVASGAGAGSQNDIGTGVIGGMLTATILAIFFVPVLFQLVEKAAPKQSLEKA
jgi:multidrug efflux pump